jgi:4'-phosphopantetheinyl transferase
MADLEKIRNPQSAIRDRVLYPVILKVPDKVLKWNPRDQVIFLRKHARKALGLSAERSGISGLKIDKDENGVPLPFDGTFWSITHKTEFVAGVVSPHPIGIDIEKIKPCSDGLFEKTACKAEWALAGQARDDFIFFYRYWTSKESVLKAATTGIKDLLKCRVQQIIDDHHLVIDYQRKQWFIEHLFFDDHIASILQNKSEIQWTID